MEDKVKVKIKPLHNIGGVGKAGDVVWMTPEEAEGYVRDGYVTPLSPSTETSPQIAAEVRGDLGGEVEEDHAVMKPEVKRVKKVVRKK